MSHATRHVLIEGVFEAPDALEILLTMLNAKIEFHQRRCFSSQERLGHTDHASERRIEELAATRSQVKATILEAKASGTRLEIRSSLELSPATEMATQASLP